MTNIHDFLCQHYDPSIAPNVPVLETGLGLAETIGAEAANELIVGLPEATDRWPAYHAPAHNQKKRVGTLVRANGVMWFEASGCS